MCILYTDNLIYRNLFNDIMLVVGGGGFIGSYVVGKLLAENQVSSVIVYDNAAQEKNGILKNIKKILNLS